MFSPGRKKQNQVFRIYRETLSRFRRFCCTSFGYQIRVFNLHRNSAVRSVFAFIVKRFRVFRAPLQIYH
ncbi:hypothetical protein [Chryseobacterium indoltheticum]|uniref:hypothetical protein n=1 Tax=Chryseobacterium indoltheticum TaxID=254 RepID=UPI003F494833